MSQLGLFLHELAQARNSNFPCPYHPRFLSADEADAIFDRFTDFDFCTTKLHWGNTVLRKGVHYVSDPHHIQVGAYTRERKGSLLVDEDGCVGRVLTFAEAPPEILSLRMKLSAFAGRDVNYISVQNYPDGNATINWHRHSEDDALNTPVFIVSTGEERKLHLRLRTDTTQRWDRVAEHGSLIVLPASFNDTHHHAILKDKSKSPRISINAKCLIPPMVWDCHAGKRYPGSHMPELNALNPAVYVGCRVTSRKDGSVIRKGTIYGNGKNPLNGHYPIIADNEEEFRKYAEKRMEDSGFRAHAITELRGKHLLCWCNQEVATFCHARVWLDIVNRAEYSQSNVAASTV